MATKQLSRVIQTLRNATHPHDEVAVSDGQLLETYVRTRDESAFAALVYRHGPMVWGVCRRVLQGHQDAEDAFQATFLVLVRKAASIVPRDIVGNWLYGVAIQTARKARATGAKRQQRERQVSTMPDPAREQKQWDDLPALLDQELSRLPDKYRAVIVLCDLEGKTRKEAALHFNLPEGTVATRLATARTMLAKRLGRCGLAVSGAALATLLSQQMASAGMPASVASSTITAASLFAAGQATVGAVSTHAVALAEGVLKTMLLTKLKWISALLLAFLVLGASAAFVTQHVWADKPIDPAPFIALQPERPKPDAPIQPVEAKKDAEPVPTVVRGVVKAVDHQARTVTVAYGTGEGTFAIAADAKIQVAHKSGNKFDNLPTGANIVLTQFTDARTARNLHATGNAYFGAVVKSVDGERRTITIHDRGADKTFAVAQDACISADGKDCKLGNIPVGAIVHVALLVDQATACNVGAQGEHLGDCGGSMIKAVDVENRTITFDDKAHASIAGKTYTVGKNANIIIDGRGGNLAELTPGSFVNITLTVDRQTVGTVNANGGPVDCDCGGSAIKAVDPDNRTLTFADDARPTIAGKTFSIAKNANIVIDGRSGTLTELPPGAMVSLRLQVDRKTAGTVHANGSNVTGVLKAVDAANHSITIDDTAYPVARDALIVINGQQAPLANLQPGVGVITTMRVDQKTIGMVQTK